jgi:RNA polymerase sigma-70 factor (ECF subfamily)
MSPESSSRVLSCPESPGATTPNLTPPRWFVTTDWGAVLAAGQPGSPDADAALSRLCQIYWKPLYSFICHRGHSPEDAKDLVQGFFADVLERNGFGDYAPEKGRFRSFLLLLLKRYMANEWHRSNRQKRGGGCQVLSMDALDTEARYLHEPVDEMTPEKAFDRSWVTTLLGRILERLEAEHSGGGKEKVFEELKMLLSREPSRSYADIGRELGMTEGAVKVAVHRLRQRYRDLLRAEIANTVSTPEEVDEEIRSLFLSFA